MNRNEAQLKEVILDLQLLNRELMHDIKQLMIEMNMMKTQLLQLSQIKTTK
jgi:hypothetical protein